MKRLLTIAMIAMTLTALPARGEDWPELKWPELIPKDWDPRAVLKDLDLTKMQDSDPRAMAALDKMMAAWDAAPVEATLAGRRLRIAGFVIPLERKGDKFTEFLLVPYFGACIHSPPPPANQIIHARSARPLAGIKTMDPLWVYGTLSIERSSSPWGTAAYRIQVAKTAPYEMPKNK
jgi:uncharacterized protein